MNTAKTKTKTAIVRPTLWVQEFIPASPLMSMFQIRDPEDTLKLGEIDPKGEHIILFDKGTPEAFVKATAWEIQAAGGEPQVHCTDQRLENLIRDDGRSPQALAAAIHSRDQEVQSITQPFKDWNVRNDEYTLTPREAADIAKVAIKLLPKRQKSIELAQLRSRSSQGVGEWKDIVESLEKEFAELVRQRDKSSDPDERLRLDLLALSKETDPIKRLRKRSEICSHYRLKSADVEMCCKALDRRTNQPQPKFYDSDELFDLESVGLTWLIPELLPKGETIILSAAPKAGKTLLAIDVALAIVTGESSFLGESVKQGKVLLISVDESLQSTRSKLIKRGLRRQDKDFISVLASWNIDQRDVLEAKLEDFRPDLVIIDSLRRINHGSQISENSAEFADNIYTLSETIGKYGASGILIHHNNKNSEAMGVDQIRGSSAIAGATWGSWILNHIPKPDPDNKKKLIIDPKDPVRVLSVIPRQAEGQRMKIEFNPEDNSWIRLDEEIKVEQETLRKRILNVLQLNRGGLSGKEIIELLQSDKVVYSELNRMVNKLLITCKPAPGDKRYNLYSVPLESGDTPPPLPCLPIADYNTETLTIQSLDNSQQDSQQVREISQQVIEANSPADYLIPDVASTSEIVSNCIAEGGGVGVAIISTESDTKLSDSVHEPAPALKEGDRVTSTKDDVYDAANGITGVIKTIFSPTTCRVEWAKACGSVFPRTEDLADLSACTINEPQTIC